MDLLLQLDLVNGLRKIIIAPGRACRSFIADHGMRGDRNNGTMPQLAERLDPLGGLPTIHQRKPEIHQDQIRLFLRRLPDAFLSVCGLDHLVFVFEQLDNEVSVEPDIVHHQDLPLRHDLPPRVVWGAYCGGVRGRVTVNVDPLPTSLATAIAPPSSVTNRFAIARPSPVPPYRLVLDMSAWWNSSKIPWSSSLAMPIPVSRTITRTVRSSCHAEILISPPSVNFTALLRRLRMTCLSFSRSVWSGGISSLISSTRRTSPLLSIGRTVAVAICTTSPNRKDSANTSILPASIFERSRRPLIRLSRCSALMRTFSRFSRWSAGMCPSVLRRTSRVKPIIA